MKSLPQQFILTYSHAQAGLKSGSSLVSRLSKTSLTGRNSVTALAEAI